MSSMPGPDVLYLVWWRPEPIPRANLAFCLQWGHSGGAWVHQRAGCAGLGKGTVVPGDPDRDLHCCLQKESVNRGQKRAMDDMQTRGGERRREIIKNTHSNGRYMIYKVFKLNKRGRESEYENRRKRWKVHEVSVKISYSQSSCLWTLKYLIHWVKLKKEKGRDKPSAWKWRGERGKNRYGLLIYTNILLTFTFTFLWECLS